MASNKTKFSVGVFMAAGIVIGLTAIIWLGMTTLFEEGGFFVTYFDESIQGLEVDSPVKYRGVPIGRVDSISVAPDSKLIQVTMRIDSGQKLDRTMVAQLKTVGITGSMFIEVNLRKPDEPDLTPAIDFPIRYPLVGSKPSDISQLLGGVEDVLKQIKQADLKGVADRFKETLEYSTSVLANANGILEENRESIKLSLNKFQHTMGKAGQFVDKGIDIMEGSDSKLAQIQNNLLVTTQNIERVSSNLDRLVETLATQPSQLLFGEPAPPREIK